MLDNQRSPESDFPADIVPSQRRKFLATIGGKMLKQRGSRGLFSRMAIGLIATIGCSWSVVSTAQSLQTWEISFVSDLGGPLNIYGTTQLGGLQTWIQHVNKAGGVAGRKVTLNVRDDRSDVQTGLSAFKEALAEKPIVLLGPFVSSVTAAAAPFAERAGVNDIMWSPVAALMTPPQPHLFAGAVTLDQMARIQASVIGELAKNQADVKIVIARLDSAAGADFSKEAQAEISKRGWKLVGEQKVALTATDISDQAAAMAKTGADYCLCATFGPTNLQLMRGLRNNGSKMTVVNYFGGGFASDMMALNDPNYYAVLNYADPGTSNLPAAEAMRAQAKEAAQEKHMVGFSFTQGYVTGMIVTQALETCGAQCDSDKFRAALKSTKFALGNLAGPTTLSNSQYVIQSGRAFRVVNNVITAVGDWRGLN